MRWGPNTSERNDLHGRWLPSNDEEGISLEGDDLDESLPPPPLPRPLPLPLLLLPLMTDIVAETRASANVQMNKQRRPATENVVLQRIIEN